MIDDRGKWIVETDWLEEHLNAPDLIVLDASWYMTSSERDAKAEYDAAHIPGAIYFDIDTVADTDAALPHTLPSSVKFSSIVRKMGIGDGMRIVVYDADGLFSAARVWWMFRVMGKTEVSILNGGLKKWIAEDRETEDLPPAPRTPRHFTARVNAQLLRDTRDVASAVQYKDPQILDARSTERFLGQLESDEPDIRVGHIPGSYNLPYPLFVNEDGTIKDNDAIRQLFEASGIDIKKPVITTCGSGITAAILGLGLSVLGHRQWSLYDGSWAEWGADHNLPIETSETVS